MGGPPRSLFALVEALAADFRFSVITSAFDDPAAGPMRTVKQGQWSTFGHAMIWYERRYRISAWRTATLLKETKPQLVYLNSFFDYRFTILPLFISRMTSRKTHVVLAPRGEFSVGALALKWRKKRVYITAFRILGLHRAITWHASTSQEKADIERVFGTGARSHVAINLRTDLSVGTEDQYHDRSSGMDPHYCSLVFFSRIVPMKNVATAIRAMPLVRGKARLSIAGPVEDARYWDECLDLIDNIGNPEMIKYVGAIPADEAISFLGRFDLFVFPTLGENFGHVVFESLAAGTPVILGNDTPWHQIETAGAGWICDPVTPEAVAELIERFLALDEDARMRMRTAARDLARQVLNDPRGVDANRAMFQVLTSSKSSRRLVACHSAVHGFAGRLLSWLFKVPVADNINYSIDFAGAGLSNCYLGIYSLSGTMLGAAGTLTNLGISAAKLPVNLQRRRRSAHRIAGELHPVGRIRPVRAPGLRDDLTTAG